MKNIKSLREIKTRMDELSEVSEVKKNPYKRILMEKEKQNISYEDLAKQLVCVSAESLKKQLTKGKIANPDLVKELYDILDIQDEFDNNEALAVYHYMENRPSDAGRPSKADRAKRQDLYDEAQQRKSDYDKGEYSIDELLLNYADNSEEAEYFEMKMLEREPLEEVEFLKKALLIYNKVLFYMQT